LFKIKYLEYFKIVF